MEDSGSRRYNAVCQGCCPGLIMPSDTLEARREEKDAERGLRSFVLGGGTHTHTQHTQGSASCDRVTLDDSRAPQRSSSMQFVGGHNLTSSPKAGC